MSYYVGIQIPMSDEDSTNNVLYAFDIMCFLFEDGHAFEYSILKGIVPPNYYYFELGPYTKKGQDRFVEKYKDNLFLEKYLKTFERNKNENG